MKNRWVIYVEDPKKDYAGEALCIVEANTITEALMEAGKRRHVPSLCAALIGGAGVDEEFIREAEIVDQFQTHAEWLNARQQP
jgi:hypothetical protein